MVPILTHNTLDHAVFNRVLWVWIWPAALAVHAREVLVVSILDILLLGRKELAGLPKSGAAVTAEVALCVKLNQCVALMAVVGAGKTDSSRFERWVGRLRAGGAGV